MTALTQALRTRHWAKNLLVFVPIITGQRVDDLQILVLGTLAFIVFCLAASGGYLINDLVDLAHDRERPSKRDRPLASGRLSPATARAMAPSLITGAIMLAWWQLPDAFLISLVCYVSLSVAYSLYFKQIVILDVLVLAGLYCVRIVGGGIATGTFVSPWLLAFSMFVFLSLALVKRYIELRRAPASHVHRNTGRGYLTEDLELLRSIGPVTGYLSVLVLALYVNTEAATTLYRWPALLWLIVPLLIYWITRIWLLAHRGVVNEDPVIFATGDRVTYFVCALVAVVLLLSAIVPPP